MSDDDDDGRYSGFFEAMQGFDDDVARRQRIRLFSDHQLIHYHRLFSDERQLRAPKLVMLLEEEIGRRGLKSVN